MVTIVINKVIGRFIYIQIPRTIEGRELSLNELTHYENDLFSVLTDEYRIEPGIILKLNENLSDLNIEKSGNFLTMIFSRLSVKRKLVRQLRKELVKQNLSVKNTKKAIRIMKSKIVLNRRIAWLSLMQRFLRYWHVAHLPFAFVMLFIMIVHIAVAVVFGYKWIF